VDTDARSRPDFAHGGADQRIDAGGVAQRSRRAQFRQELAARAFQSITGSLVLLEGIAAARNGPPDASGHAPLAHEAADRQARPNRAAGRMKKDRKLALAQSAEQVAQAAGRILIDRTLRGDPFATARAAGVRVAFRHVEHDRRPHMRGLRLGRRGIGAGRQRTRHAGGQQDARKQRRLRKTIMKPFNLRSRTLYRVAKSASMI
jgi:hypothetical protein